MNNTTYKSFKLHPDQKEIVETRPGLSVEAGSARGMHHS
jgi:hypothetical protein